MLSDNDIFRELGKNILIHPFNPSKIKGSSINLTASNRAYSLETKKSIFSGGKIEILPNDTALIETNEVIWVSKSIAGTYHSKVGLVSSGFGHIGTTLDPEWIGPSLIALHNHTKQKFCIAENESFVSLCLYYLNKPSTYRSTNKPGHTALLGKLGINFSKAAKYFEEDWVNKPEFLKKEMITSESYKNFKAEMSPFAPYWEDIKFFIKATLPMILIVGGIYFVEGFFTEPTHPVSSWMINVGSSGWMFGFLIYFIGARRK